MSTTTATRLPYTAAELGTMPRGILDSLCQRHGVRTPLGASTATMRRLLAPLCRAESQEPVAGRTEQPAPQAPAAVTVAMPESRYHGQTGRVLTAITGDGCTPVYRVAMPDGAVCLFGAEECQAPEQVTTARCAPVQTPPAAKRMPRAQLEALVQQHGLRAPLGASRGQLAALLGSRLPQVPAPKARAVREAKAPTLADLPRAELEARCREQGLYMPLGCSRKALVALLSR